MSQATTTIPEVAAEAKVKERVVEAERLTKLIERAGLPTRGPRLGAARYLELMRVDKKSESGQIRFVLIDAPGRASLHRADDALVAEAIEAHCA